MLKKVAKVFIGILSLLLVLVISLIVVAHIYKKEIIAKVVAQLNPYLNSEVRIQPNDIDFSILSAFPKAAIQFKNVTIFEPQYLKQRDTLCHAKLIQLEFNWYNILNKKYDIDKITLENGQLNLKILADGRNNWDIIKKDTTTKTGQNDVKFAIQLITANGLKLKYQDLKNNCKLKNNIANLRLSGQFDNADFEIKVELNGEIDQWHILNREMFKNKALLVKSVIQKVGDKYSFNNANLGLGKMDFTMNGVLLQQETNWITHAKIVGKHTDITAVLSLLPANITDKAKQYKSSGQFNFSLQIDGNINQTEQLFIKANVNANKMMVKEVQSNMTLSIQKLEAQYILDHNQSLINCEDFSTLLNNNPISGNFKIENLNAPSIQTKFKAKINLNDLQQFLHLDTITDLKGYCNTNIALSGKWSDIKNNFANGNTKFEGDAKIDNLYLKFKNADEGMAVTSSYIQFDNNRITINETPLSFKNNNLKISGTINNLFGYLSQEQELSIQGKILADQLEPEKWIYKDGNNDNKKEKATIIIPRITYDLSTEIELLIYDKFIAKSVKGKILQDREKISFNTISFETLDGICTLNAIASQQKDGFVFSGTSDFSNINISKLFSSLNNFGQATLTDKNIKGSASANIAFQFPYDLYMKSDLAGVKIGADLEISNGELYQLKALEKLSGFVKLSELQNIKFSQLKSHIDINNKIIAIPNIAINNSALNIKLNGTHDFANVVDYHFSLKLSELLAKRAEAKNKTRNEFEQLEVDQEDNRELFITMKGPIDNPKISYDKKATYSKFKSELAQEKQNLKNLLKSEFGLFKKDTTLKIAGSKKEDPSKMKIQFGNDPIAKKPKQLELPKKKDEEDDF